MMVREDILADLTTEPVTKIMGKPGQGDINLLEQELAEEAAEIKTTVDVVEKGKKFGFFCSGLRTTKVWNSHLQAVDVPTSSGKFSTISFIYRVIDTFIIPSLSKSRSIPRL